MMESVCQFERKEFEANGRPFCGLLNWSLGCMQKVVKRPRLVCCQWSLEVSVAFS